MAGSPFNESSGSIGQNPFTSAGQMREIKSGLDPVIELIISGLSGAEISLLLLDFMATTFSVFDVFP